MTLAALARRSLDVVLENQAPSGAYLASPALPVYRYAWLRDGSFAADAASRAGAAESAERFFAWCAGVIGERAERIEHGGRLDCRYTVDGAEVPGAWSSFQLDGYGSWVWALGEHAGRHGADVEPYARAVALSARYAIGLWQEPCFDWWEERLGVHTPTLASLYAGLRTAARLEALLPDGLGAAAGETAAAIRAAVRQDAEARGRLGRSLGDDALDASLLASAVPFGLLAVDDPLVTATVAAVEETLVHGGVHRHAGDTFYGGGEWLLLTALLGWHEAEAGRPERAWSRLEWVAARAGAGGDLPEQSDECLLAPAQLAPWRGRFGAAACPLVWSHAFFLTLALRLGVCLGEERRVA